MESKMAAPKKPADHKPKDAPKPSVTESPAGWVVKHRGVEVSIDREALDDFELLDDLAELQRDAGRGSVRVPSMLRRLAGEAGFQAVTAGLRDPATGRVKASEAVSFVFEVFQALNPNS